MIQPMETLNFTVPAIEALPAPAKGRVRYKDAKKHGLILAVTPRAKTFYLLKRSGGKLYEIRIGAFPQFKPDEARGKVDEMLGALERDEDPHEVTGRRRKGETFGSLFDWWLTTHAKVRLRPRTWRSAETLYARELAGPLGDRPVHVITRAELGALHASVAAGVAARGRHKDARRFAGSHTANDAIQLVGNVIRHAILMERYKGPDPTTGLKRAPEQPRDRMLTPAELPRFFQALKVTTPTIRDYILLSLFTGARQANVCAMRWDEIDFHQRQWRIPRTKSGKAQIVPLEDAEIAILRERQAGRAGGGPWVFPSRVASATGHLIDPERGWRKVTKAAGLEDLRLHDLRRSFGSWMLHQGAHMKVVSKSLGHSSMAITDGVYAHLMDLDPIRQGKRAALRAIAAAASAHSDGS